MRALAVLVAMARVARAEPEQYRNVLMLGDAAAATFVVGGSALAYHERNCTCEDFSGELVLFGVAAYASIGAFVHHDAGRNDRAVASVALRIALPIATGELAHGLGADLDHSLLAAGGGMLAAAAIDWFALADATAPARSNVGAFVRPTSGGFVAGLAGPL
jgi:hypothetical protein